MKKLYILLIALFALNGAQAQDCLPDGITFSTQTQIDSFQINYPGCTQIEGFVQIGEGWGGNITNLNGLSVLTSIGGDLLIIGNDALPNLSGLNNLNNIGGDIQIGGNFTLTSLTGLEGLTSVPGDITLSVSSADGPIGNPDLQNLTGLNNLTSIGGVFTINKNSSLIDLTGLENLTSIVGGLIVWGNSSMVSLTGVENLATVGDIRFGQSYHGANPQFTSLMALQNLDSINGNLIIENCPSLANLAGLNNVTSISGSLLIGEYYGNSSLTDLTGLNSLTSIGGDCAIQSNDILPDLTGLESLISIGGALSVIKNDVMTSLSGIDNLTAGSISDLYIFDNVSLSSCGVECICNYLASPGGSVNIYNNATGCYNTPEVVSNCGLSPQCLPYGNYYFLSQDDIDNFQINYPDCEVLAGNVHISGADITNLDELIIVTSTGGSLTVYENPILNNLTGLDNLGSVGSDLTISANDSLTNLTGLGSLTTIGGGATISGNSLLNDFGGLDSLNSIGGGLIIHENHTLLSLTGIENLNSVGGNLELVRNYILPDLNGLEGLTSIGGELLIGSNGALTSLAGLDNINAASIANMYIEFNNSLSTCEVQSVCDYIANPNGYTLIGYNANGCNSVGEVEEACAATSVNEILLDNTLSIYPNPSSGYITIETPARGHLSILNLNDQQILTRQITEPKTTIDINNLPSGVYFVRLTGERTVKFGKFIKE